MSGGTVFILGVSTLLVALRLAPRATVVVSLAVLAMAQAGVIDASRLPMAEDVAAVGDRVEAWQQERIGSGACVVRLAEGGSDCEEGSGTRTQSAVSLIVIE